MPSLHRTAFKVTSINGTLHVTWTNSDASTTNEIVDPQREFASDSELVAFLNDYARMWNLGKDQEYVDANPTIVASVQNAIGQTFQVT